MATVTDSASTHSATSSRPNIFPSDGPNNHQFRRSAAGNSRALPSPWSQIVRGESEAIPATPSSLPPPHSAQASGNSPTINPASESSPDSDHFPAKSPSSENAPEASEASSSDNGARAKKTAWGKPSDGVVEVGAVMGAVSWPALSESTRASPKSSSDSLKNLTDGSVSQGPVIASSPQKPVSNTNSSSNPNHVFPGRQKPMGKRNGPANGGLPVEMPQKVSDKPANVPDTASKDLPQKNNWETGSRSFGSQGHTGNDQPRNTFRRASGPHPRGDGPHHHNYGNRVTVRDQERVNYEWNSHRGFNGRDVHIQQRVGPRNFLRPPATTPFINPARGFGNPMGFPEMPPPVYYVPAAPPESIRAVPFVTHAPPPVMFYPAPDPQLRVMVVKQIEYYFSTDNLIRDTFLRQNMDAQGWVHVSVIAEFNRVKMLTNNVQFILDALRGSTVVEVQGEKLRKRSDWLAWLLPSSPFGSTTNPPQSPVLPDNSALATHMRNMGLGEGATDFTNTRRVPSRSSSGDYMQLQPEVPAGSSNGGPVEQIGIGSESSHQPATARSSARN